MVANAPASKPLPPGEARSYLLHWQDERNSAALYEGLATQERKPRLARAFHHLAVLEEGHAEVWAEKLHEAGIAWPDFKPSWRTRLLILLARRLGTAVVLPRIASLERLEADGYLKGQHTLFDEEQENAALLKDLSQHEVTEFFKKLILRLRKTVLLVIGATLFTVSLLLARNVQLEGLFFGLLTGVFIGPVMHYLLGKVLIALPFGRIWCGWAC
jgi:hypothetical protein